MAGEANTSHPPDDLPEPEQDRLDDFREQAERLSVFEHGICSLHPIPLQMIDHTGEFDRPNHFGTVARVGDGLTPISPDNMRDDEQSFIGELGAGDSVIVVQSTYPLNMHQDIAMVGESDEYTYIELHSRSGGEDADTFIRTLIRLEDAALPKRLIVGNHFSATGDWEPGEIFGGNEIPGNVVLEASHTDED